MILTVAPSAFDDKKSDNGQMRLNAHIDVCIILYL